MAGSLTKEQSKVIDRISIKIFQHQSKAFLSPLLCNVLFELSDETETAATDGLKIYLNEDFFFKLSLDSQVDVVIHELWHIGRLHNVRIKSRDRNIFNVACDYRINNDMKNAGHKFKGLDPLVNKNYDDPYLSEEEIYRKLVQGSIKIEAKVLSNDVLPSDGNDSDTKIITNVISAATQAEQSNPGSVPGDISSFLGVFLKPKITWQDVLYKYLDKYSKKRSTWRRPNRRFQNIYLPSYQKDQDNRLKELCIFIDTSGSLSDDDLNQFNSEVKYIKETYRPDKLSIITFDTKLQDHYEFLPDDDYAGINIHGRGGTSLVEVQEYIRKNNPTITCIFSDMYVRPMDHSNMSNPLIYVVMGNKDFTSPYGEVVHF